LACMRGSFHVWTVPRMVVLLRGGAIRVSAERLSVGPLSRTLAAPWPGIA